MLMSKVVKKLTLAIGYHRLAKKKKTTLTGHLYY